MRRKVEATLTEKPWKKEMFWELEYNDQVDEQIP